MRFNARVCDLHVGTRLTGAKLALCEGGASLDEAVSRRAKLTVGDLYEVNVRKIVPPPTTVPAKLGLDERIVLQAFAESGMCWHEDWCLGFNSMGLERAAARRTARKLKRKGLLAFARGLFTEDGETAGAGYHLTNLGREAITYLVFLGKLYG